MLKYLIRISTLGPAEWSWNGVEFYRGFTIKSIPNGDWLFHIIFGVDQILETLCSGTYTTYCQFNVL